MPKGIYPHKLHTEEHNKKIGLALKGHKGRLGQKFSIEQRTKMRLAQLGEKSHLWKGGINPIHNTIRKSLEYRLWRQTVFIRDNFTCVWCGAKGYVQADHIKPFAQYPELRFAIDNGRTLCIKCHKTTETFGGKNKKTKCQ